MVYILLENGFEEIEALAVADILRRAKINVETVSCINNTNTVSGAHKISVNADINIKDIAGEYDMIILPGGYPGYENLINNPDVKYVVENAYSRKKYIAAICASPSILGKWGMLKGITACCYPSFEDELLGANVSYNPVVTEGNIITSRGAGTAHLFAFEIVKILKNSKTADEIKSSMIYE